MFETIDEFQVWLIYLLPLASFALIFLHYWLPKGARPSPRLLSTVSILAIFGSFLLSLWTLQAVRSSGHSGEPLNFSPHHWIEIQGLTIDIGLRVDGLTAVMLVVVTSVAFLVQFYSQGYMAGDPGYPRYYAFLSLFTTAMLGLVLADNLIMAFIHWELVGLSSYLLIGFWFPNPPRPGYTSPAAAAKKAFIVTRAGDLGFLIAILLIWTRAGTFNIAEIQELALAGSIGSTTLTLFALGIFAGAAGKSAQFPFHTWLPDAMEGPTPVSALIHAATMVAAGVYLVARLFPVYSASDEAMATVAAIGAITAVVAATMGLVMHDLKRVLAYSTISQLGYMMLALGSGGLVAGIFHLFNHAFFKALLFLGSGSVNHGTGTFDMRKMGGLARPMPLTFITFAIGSLSLAGIWPLSGFWSKDEVLLDAWHYNKVVFAAALGVAFMTAFYMTRAVCLTFFGEYRGGDPSGVHSAHDDTSGHAAATHGGGDEAHEPQGTVVTAHASHDTHGATGEVTPHESPPSMVLPLLILAIPSIASGFFNAGGIFGKNFGHFIEASLPDTMHLEHHEFSWGIAISSSALAVFGIVLAAALYGVGARVRVAVPAGLRWLHTLFYRKYFMDDIYEDGVVRGVMQRGICALCAWFDATIVDGAVNGAARLASWASGLLRRAQTGSEQSYGLVLTGGAAIVALVVFLSALR